MIELSSAWSIFGVLGIVCALIYRLPQAKKLYVTKKSDDVSMKSFTVQTCAYVCFILYMFKYFDPILFFYYVSGGIQNICVLYLIKKYRSSANSSENSSANSSANSSENSSSSNLNNIETDIEMNSSNYIGDYIPKKLSEFIEIPL